jgi:hypothetical protein
MCETTGGPPLDEDAWHVTDYYENIRTKAKNLEPSNGYCGEGLVKKGLPERVCTTAMQVRTVHTVRRLDKRVLTDG